MDNGFVTEPTEDIIATIYMEVRSVQAQSVRRKLNPMASVYGWRGTRRKRKELVGFPLLQNKSWVVMTTYLPDCCLHLFHPVSPRCRRGDPTSSRLPLLLFS